MSHGTKIISKEAKQAYSDFLRKRVKEGGDELKLREASSFAQKQTPLCLLSKELVR
jgi:hypothetical protein